MLELERGRVRPRARRGPTAGLALAKSHIEREGRGATRTRGGRLHAAGHRCAKAQGGCPTDGASASAPRRPRRGPGEARRAPARKSTLEVLRTGRPKGGRQTVRDSPIGQHPLPPIPNTAPCRTHSTTLRAHRQEKGPLHEHTRPPENGPYTCVRVRRADLYTYKSAPAYKHVCGERDTSEGQHHIRTHPHRKPARTPEKRETKRNNNQPYHNI